MGASTSKELVYDFENEIYKGLTSYPKYLSSRFIYDRNGNKLFKKITELPEYYITRTEYDILNTFKEQIISNFDQSNEGFDMIELGAGDGRKTKILLQELLARKRNFIYKPIDISKSAIEGLKDALTIEYPAITLEEEIGEYFEVLDRLKYSGSRKKVIMILGASFGNLLHPNAIRFLKKLHDIMNNDDLIFMGFDQKKHPKIILDAYNDQSGTTAAFNKNLLKRINIEFDANFDMDKFLHWAAYDPETGTVKTYLVSKEPQQIKIAKLNLSVSFESWETIHTEISQKYDDRTINWLTEESGLQIIKSFSDEKLYYKNYIFKKKY